MDNTRIDSRRLTLIGEAIPGALDRQSNVPGFRQDRVSASRVVCIGAGGLISHIAPTLARKGIGALTILDDDEVEVTNLNRQRFYISDLGTNKALALAAHLQRECTFSTRIEAWPLRLEEVLARGVDLRCDVAICGVDNNPARVLASRYFRAARVPVIFCAVSAQADHGYVFIQGMDGPCFACLFPDALNDGTYPCPGTPALGDILQAVGALVTYAVSSCLSGRNSHWNYRRINLADGAWDCCAKVEARIGCPVCAGSMPYTLTNPEIPT